MVNQAITDMSPKAVRMSVVAITAATMGVVWAVVDSATAMELDAVVVSSVTALVMLIAQFYDYKATVAGVDLFEGDSE